MKTNKIPSGSYPKLPEKKAKESADIKRLRRRLEKHLNQQNSKTTTEALHAISKSIQTSLERKTQEGSRVSLKEKSITLFDQNKHSAVENKATQTLRKLIKKDYFHQ